MRHIVPCSLKINLALRVFGRRADGYHDVYSLYMRLPSPDILEIGEAEGRDTLKVLGLEIAGRNILEDVCSAARAVKSDMPHLDMRLFKHVPTGSGVGAGSGNAAALLRWLSRRYDLPAMDVRAAAGFGADVAFLFSPFSVARAGGIGEILADAGPSPATCALLCFPQWRSGTRHAYARLDALRLSGELPTPDGDGTEDEGAALLDSLREGERSGPLPNDFAACMPEHAADYDALYRCFEGAGALAWGLCGSGSAAVALFDARPVCGGDGIEAAHRALRATARFPWLQKTLILE